VESLEERLLLSADSERFVNKVYLDLLRRSAEAGALSFFGNRIDQGLTRNEFVQEITRSLEYRHRRVEQQYLGLLGRAADIVGRNIHAALLISGGDEDDVRQSLLGSAEYFSRAGGSNTAFLTALYRDTLGRALDPSGQATYTGLLQRGLSRGQVAAFILDSREGHERLVDNFFRQYLRRPIDPAGQQGFAGALDRGATEAEVLGGILGSAEYNGIPPGGGVPPTLTARLNNDTGESNTDGITADPTITGSVTSVGRVTRLRAGFGATPAADVTASLQASGQFTLDRTRLSQVNGGTLPDGRYTLRLDAQNEFGSTSMVVELTFTLDTTNPTVVFNLDPASDTPPLDDLRTDRATVTLTGTTEANATVAVTAIGIMATTGAGEDGRFTFADIRLLNGPNALTVRATDTAGNRGQLVRTIERNNVPVAGAPLDVTVTQSSAPITRSLVSLFSYDTVVRFDTVRGPIEVELFDERTPITVANFLAYANAGDFANTVFHRSVPGFVIQGGGFRFMENPSRLPEVTSRGQIMNEPGISNRRGTIAMAKLPPPEEGGPPNGGPNSATSQWFFNLADNSANLDNQNGGFTVFGQVLGNGMTVADDIATITQRTVTDTTVTPPRTFQDFPLINYTGTNFPTDTVRANFAIVNNITVVQRRETLTYTLVSNSNMALVTAQVVGNNIMLSFTPNQTGTALITVRATDRTGASAEGTVRVTVNPP
jgi:cyclophilin family peptidyl-prolyl cis-trans isomerase